MPAPPGCLRPWPTGSRSSAHPPTGSSAARWRSLHLHLDRPSWATSGSTAATLLTSSPRPAQLTLAGSSMISGTRVLVGAPNPVPRRGQGHETGHRVLRVRSSYRRRLPNRPASAVQPTSGHRPRRGCDDRFRGLRGPNRSRQRSRAQRRDSRGGAHSGPAPRAGQRLPPREATPWSSTMPGDGSAGSAWVSTGVCRRSTSIRPTPCSATAAPNAPSRSRGHNRLGGLHCRPDRLGRRGREAWAVLLREIAVLGYLAIIMNSVPVLQVDGHWFLADALDRPTLHRDSQAALIAWIRRRPADRRLAAYAAGASPSPSSSSPPAWSAGGPYSATCSGPSGTGASATRSSASTSSFLTC